MSGKFMMNGIEYLGGGSGGGGGGNVDDVKVNGVSVVDANKEAQITSYKEVTLAEYQALPSSKLSDDVMYCIKDVGGANEFPPIIYSYEEREVGVWADGKPLYQKCFDVGAISSNSSVNIDVTALSIDKIVACNGGAYSSQYSQKYPMPFADKNNSSYAIEVQLIGTNLNVATGSNMPISECHIAIQYTKTTDVAGSGTWTPDGTYAHHYSKDEKVIGTYIDGKPIYEKVLDDITFNATNVAVTHNLNVDTYVYIGGWCTVNGGSIMQPFPFIQNGSQYCSLYYVDTKDKLYVISTWSNNKVRLLLRYTKLSD